MEIAVAHTDGITVLALQGRFLGDLAVDDFCETIRKLLTEGSRLFIIDLAGIDYINSMGLGALIAGFIMAKTEGGRLAYANANAGITTLLHLTKTDRSVPVYKTLEEARTAFELSRG